METKKSPKADIEKNRTIYLLMGFVVVLSSFFVLIEWETSSPDLPDWQNLMPAFVESEFSVGTNNSDISEEVVADVVMPEIVYEGYHVVDEILPEEEFFADSIASVSIVNPIEIPAEKKSDPQVVEPEMVEPVHTEAEVMPYFPGGTTELIRFIYQHIQYPSAALKQRIQGRVWCSFIVNANGQVSDVQLEEGVYIFLDDEAIRVLNLMPPWIPGKNKGEPVRVKVYIPVVFKL